MRFPGGKTDRAFQSPAALLKTTKRSVGRRPCGLLSSVPAPLRFGSISPLALAFNPCVRSSGANKLLLPAMIRPIAVQLFSQGLSMRSGAQLMKHTTRPRPCDWAKHCKVTAVPERASELANLEPTARSLQPLLLHFRHHYHHPKKKSVYLGLSCNVNLSGSDHGYRFV